jgi:predicted aldo/keto reductase-like oxidoreductase
MSPTRRDFLRAASSAAGALLLGEAGPTQTQLPKRTLGRTGLEVSILALGLGAAGDGNVDPGIVTEVIEAALDAGVNWIDTAPNYERMQATLGGVVARRRPEAYVTTKVEEHTRIGALAQIEQSRRELQVDVVDVAFIHNLGDFDRDHLLGPEGAFTALREAREAGHVRFLGVSGHSRPGKFAPVIRTGEVDVVMVAMNYVDRHIYDFEEQVLPAAGEQQCGTLCMKVLGGVPNWNYRNVGHARLGALEHYESAVRYALSLDVAAAVMGLCNLTELRAALDAVRRFRPLTEDERAALLATGARLAPEWGPHYGPAD